MIISVCNSENLQICEFIEVFLVVVFFLGPLVRHYGLFYVPLGISRTVKLLNFSRWLVTALSVG